MMRENAIGERILEVQIFGIKKSADREKPFAFF